MSGSSSRERIVFIEYHDDIPHAAVTSDSKGYFQDYDLDWCKRDDRLYWHQSGGWPDRPIVIGKLVEGTVKFWATGDIKIKDGHNGVSLSRPLRKFPLKTLLDPDNEMETIYCSECDDHLPTEDSPNPCDHIWWCKVTGWWSTPDERCAVGCVDDGCRETANGAKTV